MSNSTVYFKNKLFLLTALGSLLFGLCETRTVAQQVALTTVILVRHAEKQAVPPENKDPDLNSAGVARAQELARMFGGSGINAIYASQYKRTQQTVQPLAGKLNIPVSRYDTKKVAELVKEIRFNATGRTIFIAGHNNTVPEIITALTGVQMPIIPESEFDNLYILTLSANDAPKLLKLKFGSPLPSSGSMMSPP